VSAVGVIVVGLIVLAAAAAAVNYASRTLVRRRR
jgi:hypothetical protein